MFIAVDFKFFEGAYETWLTIRESVQVFCNTEFGFKVHYKTEWVQYKLILYHFIAHCMF